MKNITFSAREEAIEKARFVAMKKQRTLNELFREWLDSVNHQIQDEDIANNLKRLWRHTNYVKVGKKLSSEVRNER